jgi:hypothetical protein
MSPPVPILVQIQHRAMDAIALAQDIPDAELRAEIITQLRAITGHADLLHNARLIARGLEDRGELSAWQKRKIREVSGLDIDARRRAAHASRVQELEHRPLPMGKAVS